ncbi:hypothetical protein BBI08_09000 [Planococcus halocryophilus]|uniref:Uncharacterized protein n=1 Tax=Planococcus halocryophilus TaxID=1215089 RepID=A0A1C7DQW7_9BACL|nr:hypothetical protein BBI08_09000 [Planococcus halocryophilus]
MGIWIIWDTGYFLFLGNLNRLIIVAFGRFGHGFRKKPRSAFVFSLRLALGAPRLGSWLI